jgi:hypothetical protein
MDFKYLFLRIFLRIKVKQVTIFYCKNLFTITDKCQDYPKTQAVIPFTGKILPFAEFMLSPHLYINTFESEF